MGGDVFAKLLGYVALVVISRAMKYLSALSGCFWCRQLCADVTHPRPLSRGEVRDAAFLLVMRDLSGEDSPS